MSDDPKSVVLAYHDAFYRDDRAAVRALLADRGEFAGPISSYADADAFLDSASVFMRLTRRAEIKAVVAEGRDVCVVYESEIAVPSIPVLPIASWFQVERGKITRFRTHFDPSSIIRAKESGQLAAALARPAN